MTRVEATLDIVFDFSLATSRRSLLPEFGLTSGSRPRLRWVSTSANCSPLRLAVPVIAALNSTLGLTGDAVEIDSDPFDLSGSGSVAIDLRDLIWRLRAIGHFRGDGRR